MKKWKYIKGCDKDFVGGHTEATHKYLHKECGHPVWTAKPEIIKAELFDLVALREPATDEDDLNDCIGAPEADNKYLHEIKPGVFVDVYDVLMAWNVTNPALQHLIKKALQAGRRGHKSREQDLQDIIDSAIRAKELEIK